MVYLIANIWKLKIYTVTVFEKKRARQTTLHKYFKEKQTSGTKCELVNEKSVPV
jgi:hypothetical protein